MKPSSFTLIAALVVIGVGGFMAGRISTSASSASATTADGPATTKSSRAIPTSSSAGATGSDHESRRTNRTATESSAERLTRLDAIIRGENPLDRNRALLAYIDQLGPGDFEEAVTRFRDLGITESRMGEYTLLLSAWAKTDPLAALAYAKENTGSPFATNTILTTWASSDPDAAIRWAETNHQGDGANPYMAGIIRSLAATDPARATQLLTAMPRSQERGQALEAMMPHLLAQGSGATRAWIEGITDEALRNGAMMRVAGQLAATDPAGTVSWLLSNPGEATQRRMDDVYSTWARNDEQAALTSLASLPSGENRSNALRGIVASVATRNPQAAVSLLDRYPNDVNDGIVQNVIWHSLGNDPAVAVNQIPRIADERQRNQMYRRTLETWLQRDPNAANAWMRANPLPQPVLDQLNRPRN
jgi:hypothetical protein